LIFQNNFGDFFWDIWRAVATCTVSAFHGPFLSDRWREALWGGSTPRGHNDRGGPSNGSGPVLRQRPSLDQQHRAVALEPGGSKLKLRNAEPESKIGKSIKGWAGAVAGANQPPVPAEDAVGSASTPVRSTGLISIGRCTAA
jgi:hypothetical protein